MNKLKGLRLLTLICFIQFSGLNYGYAYIRDVSPLCVTQSLFLVGDHVKGLSRVMSPSGFLLSLTSGHRFITNISLNVQKTFSQKSFLSIPSLVNHEENFFDLLSKWKAFVGFMIHSDLFILGQNGPSEGMQGVPLFAQVGMFGAMDIYYKDEVSLWAEPVHETLDFSGHVQNAMRLPSLMSHARGTLWGKTDWGGRSFKIIKEAFHHRMGRDSGDGENAIQVFQKRREKIVPLLSNVGQIFLIRDDSDRVVPSFHLILRFLAKQI